MRASILFATVGFGILLTACGDDDGSGGGGAAQTTTTTATTGTPGTTGTQNTTSGTTTGGGNPFAACAACAADACGEILQDCADDPDCATWQACVAACEDGTGLAACLDTCDDAAIGLAPSHLVYACGCTACPTECGGVEACDRKCNDGGPPPIDTGVAPANLAETGLYLPGTSDIASWSRLFQPEYALWSDGATKNRYAYIPTCEPIDTSDPDHFGFPVGTRLWKEFTRDGVRIETRLIHRYGPDSGDWLFATYQWPVNSGSPPDSALLVDDAGVPNANGTGHDIPSQGECTNCHGKLPERVLGFSAIQLSHDLGGLDLFDLDAFGQLTVSPPNGGYSIPDDGNGTTRAALGHLHANCGNCHNSNLPFPDMRLRVLTTNATPQDTDTYTTAVDVPTVIYQVGNILRVDGADPSNSAIWERMDQSTMPPVGSEIPDPSREAISDWILTLP